MHRIVKASSAVALSCVIGLGLIGCSSSEEENIEAADTENIAAEEDVYSLGGWAEVADEYADLQTDADEIEQGVTEENAQQRVYRLVDEIIDNITIVQNGAADGMQSDNAVSAAKTMYTDALALDLMASQAGDCEISTQITSVSADAIDIVKTAYNADSAENENSDDLDSEIATLKSNINAAHDALKDCSDEEWADFEAKFAS
ncbi:MAG: hypothetical protein LUB61_06230 [Eggerthellaceae bacterium]|nr:hypothetical protein [Eggerthellaceae bacterium]